MNKVYEHPLASNPAIKNFRKYLQIKSVQPNPDYGKSFCFFTVIQKTFDNPAPD